MSVSTVCFVSLLYRFCEENDGDDGLTDRAMMMKIFVSLYMFLLYGLMFVGISINVYTVFA